MNALAVMLAACLDFFPEYFKQCGAVSKDNAHFCPGLRLLVDEHDDNADDLRRNGNGLHNFTLVGPRHDPYTPPHV